MKRPQGLSGDAEDPSPGETHESFVIQCDDLTHMCPDHPGAPARPNNCRSIRRNS